MKGKQTYTIRFCLNRLMKLQEVCDVYSGFAFKQFNDDRQGYPVIKIGNILADGSLSLTNCQYTDEIVNDKYYSVKDDIYIALSGATTGKIGQIKTTDRFVINQRVGIVRNINPDIPTDYIKYFLFNKTEKILEDAIGCAQPNISPKQIGMYDFPLLPSKKMAQIAATLDKVIRTIDLCNAILEKLDLLVKARFVEMFGDPVTNDMNWQTHSVEEVCSDIYGGGTPSKAHPEYYENGNIPWVSSKDMKADIITESQIYINQLGVENSTTKMVPVNSVIMVIRSGILKHTLPVAINAVPITVNQDLKVFIPDDCILALFLSTLFKMLEKDILSGVRAVTADNIEFNSLKQRQIIVPPIELQTQFAAFVEQTDKSKLAVKKVLEKAETLKKALMQEYFG